MRKQLGAVAAGLALLVVGLVASTAPASADVPPVQVASAYEQFDFPNEGNSFGKFAQCPTGTHVVGGGYALGNENTRVISVEPDLATNRLSVGFFTPFDRAVVTVYATCLTGA